MSNWNKMKSSSAAFAKNTNAGQKAKARKVGSGYGKCSAGAMKKTKKY